MSFSQQSLESGKVVSFTEGGILAGNPDNENKAPFIFHSSVNYVFYKHLSAGIGAGVEFLKETYLPVTANMLYQFNDTKSITPFVKIQTGYQLPLENKTFMDGNYYVPGHSYYPGYLYSEKLEAKGGWMVNPSAGVIIHVKPGLGISIAAGYRYQKLNYTGERDYKFQIEYNRLSLALGIIF